MCLGETRVGWNKSVHSGQSWSWQTWREQLYSFGADPRMFCRCMTDVMSVLTGVLLLHDMWGTCPGNEHTNRPFFGSISVFGTSL